MKKFEIFNPYDNISFGKLSYMSDSDIEKKIQKGYEISINRKKWLKPYQRIQILEEFLNLLSKNKLKIIRQAILEGGKPFIDTKIEFERALNGIKIAINNIPQLLGREISMGITVTSENRAAYTFREPKGLVLAISAFNHPINLIIHQVIPAIAANCPILIKPALKTPYTCIEIIKLLEQTSIPKNWCQLILCENEITNKISSDSRISFLSFIGSSKVGWKLRSNLASGTTCALEHGGVAPVIIEKDSNIKELIPLVIKGAFYHAGQVCVSTQKLFINNKIIDKVANNLILLTQKLIVGDPANEQVGIEVGPLITPENVDRIDLWVKNAIQKGAKLLCGGKKISNTCYLPTVLLDPPQDVEVSREEVFGPVLCLYSFNDRNYAIEQSNSLPYSFQASVFTKDINIAVDTIKKLNATAVMVNDHTAFRVDWMPFGGRKQSGLSMGGIINSMHDMTYEKMVVLKSNFL